MSQILPFTQEEFTQEEIREWEEIELQKKKEDRKQYIERGLSINARHEKWRQMRAAAPRSIAALVARELPVVAGNSKSNYLLDSTTDSSEAHLIGLDPQGSFIANDGSFKSPSAHRPLSIDACARQIFERASKIQSHRSSEHKLLMAIRTQKIPIYPDNPHFETLVSHKVTRRRPLHTLKVQNLNRQI